MAARLARLRECTPQRTHLVPFPLFPSPFKKGTSKKELVERRHRDLTTSRHRNLHITIVDNGNFAVVSVSRRLHRDGQKELRESKYIEL